jgi:hypothetical protein
LSWGASAVANFAGEVKKRDGDAKRKEKERWWLGL